MQKPDALRQSRPLRSPEQIGADTTPSYLPMPALLIAPIKAKILLAAECSRNGIIDRPVADDRKFREVLWLLQRSDYQLGYFDVPLASIVALQHKNMAENASPWRELFGGRLALRRLCLLDAHSRGPVFLKVHNTLLTTGARRGVYAVAVGQAPAFIRFPNRGLSCR
ncbi:hypothetical protein GIY62_24835 [Burkholderia plantarii]|uniref:hypothetical protein n=1 Tax=Burkholderia plantarii TaxID=41899 RepID=UPI00272D3DC7|nr:hypothetical protein [Burkholderia plantarii]WLE63512.1 hypothetical protein GIY62_24835 [Burkholderia plantarii]